MQQYYGDTPRIIDKKGKNRTKKANNRNKKIPALVVALVFCVSLVALIWATTQPTKNLTSNTKCWYFLCVDVQTTSEKAQISATDVREKGGAGFIINDGKYNVIASVYDKESDVKKVSKNIENSTVYPLKIESISLVETSNKSLNSSVEKAFGIHEKIYSEVMENLALYENGKIEESKLWYAVEKITEEVVALNEKLRSFQSTYDLLYLPILCDYLQSSSAVLTNSSSVFDGLSVSKIRYALCQIIRSRKAVSDEIKG